MHFICKAVEDSHVRLQNDAASRTKVTGVLTGAKMKPRAGAPG